jgi:hypothetical protein
MLRMNSVSVTKLRFSGCFNIAFIAARSRTSLSTNSFSPGNTCFGALFFALRTTTRDKTSETETELTGFSLTNLTLFRFYRRHSRR